MLCCAAAHLAIVTKFLTLITPPVTSRTCVVVVGLTTTWGKICYLCAVVICAALCASCCGQVSMLHQAVQGCFLCCDAASAVLAMFIARSRVNSSGFISINFFPTPSLATPLINLSTRLSSRRFADPKLH